MHIFSDATIFTQLRFWALVLCSLVLPAAIFVTLFVRREFSKVTVLAFGLLLILLAGLDIFLLRALAITAQATPSLADDIVFSSELSIALYIFPAAFGTFGLNMVSHVLMHYLKRKEALFEAHQIPPLPPKPAAQVRVARERVRDGSPGLRQRRVSATPRVSARQGARPATGLRSPAGG
ncbi:hypothetical protein [Variovorax sp. PAMC26660]|uniref:hypothetical protein n=1 Tax=Variovorax sp. PAMC26660 TaxID=2762322 RepID=UPI00164E343F|nr:hypothetical protein [Variovorax sp. PAMC26660]QNK66239.1 hypothetical protein H7F35_24000 [Variovorax sp. PAMC26660]